MKTQNNYWPSHPINFI